MQASVVNGYCPSPVPYSASSYSQDNNFVDFDKSGLRKIIHNLMQNNAMGPPADPYWYGVSESSPEESPSVSPSWQTPQHMIRPPAAYQQPACLWQQQQQHPHQQHHHQQHHNQQQPHHQHHPHHQQHPHHPQYQQYPHPAHLPSPSGAGPSSAPPVVDFPYALDCSQDPTGYLDTAHSYHDPQHEARLLRRREQNKQAAQRCRQKRREQEVHLEQELRGLEGENSSLAGSIFKLKNEKARLEAALHKHAVSCTKSLSTTTTPSTSPTQRSPGAHAHRASPPYHIP